MIASFNNYKHHTISIFETERDERSSCVYIFNFFADLYTLGKFGQPPSPPPKKK